MSQGRLRREALAPSLFPFLAVLLCTVGSLIVILVIAVFQAQAAARSNVAEAVERVQENTDALVIATDELKARRDHQLEEIATQRSLLSHFEGSIERLNEEIEQLKESLAELDRRSVAQPSQEIDQQIRSLEMKIAQAQASLEDKLEESKDRKPAFAIVPFSGTNGTSRRPSYLECTKQGVIIQPEGLLISMEALRPPYGPGNPIDAALRTIRNEFEHARAFTSEQSAPYPLLMVRPEGIQSYALARNAMSSWDDQFGYELIAADMPLAFPPSLPGLREKLEQSLIVAKERQQALIAAMPAPMRNALMEADYFENADTSSSDSWDDTTIEPQSGGELIAGRAGNNWQVVQELPSGSSMASGGLLAGSTPGTRPDAEAPSGRDELILGGDGSMTGPRNQADSLLTSMPDRGETRSWNGDPSPSTTSDVPAGDLGAYAGESTSGSASSSTRSSHQTANSNPGKQATMGTGGNSPSMQLSTPSDTPDGLPPDPPSIGYQMREPKRYEPPSKSNHTSASSKGDSAQDVTPISVSQGQGWAESRAKGKSTPVVREIYIKTFATDWHVLDEYDRNRVETIISTENGPSFAGKELAEAIKKRVSSWGMAVAGGHWKPRVVIEIHPQSETSAQRLQRLLEGSGVEIQIASSSQVPSLRRLPQVR